MCIDLQVSLTHLTALTWELRLRGTVLRLYSTTLQHDTFTITYRTASLWNTLRNLSRLCIKYRSLNMILVIKSK